LNTAVTLDTTILADIPEGIGELVQEIQFHEEYKGFFNFMTNELTFNGDGYDYIENILFTQSPCNQIDFLLNIEGVDYFEGVIDMTESGEFNLSRETVRVPVNDNNVSSYITKNAKIKTFLNVTKSKNGVAISAATRVTNLDMFTPSTGAYDLTDQSQAYPVGDAFRYLVEFMSDGKMTATSPLFDSGGAREGVMIINGAAFARFDIGASPYVSFFDLFKEMDKLYNIAFRIDYTTNTMIIDTKENLYTSTNIYTASQVRDLKLSFTKDMFYSKIKIGSNKVQEPSDSFTFPLAVFLGFSEEEYFTLGQCNIDNELDLVNNYIIDSNAMEDMLLNFNDTYKEDTVIIETDYPGTNQATKYDNLIPGTFVYNLGLNNFNKSQNWLGSFPNDIVAYLNNEANNFEAQRNSYILVTGNIIHTTEITDPGNNYDPVTGRYTCPLAGEGSYTFVWDYTGLDYAGVDVGVTTATVQLVHYDSGGTIIETLPLKTFISEIPTATNSYGSVSASVYLQPTDYVRIEGTVLTGTMAFGLITFSGDFADEGGTYQAYNPNDYKTFLLEFEAPLTMTNFLSIRNNLTKTITVTSGTKTFKGWVKSLKREILTGMTKFILRTSNNSRA
jgi:hypothetical protein